MTVAARQRTELRVPALPVATLLACASAALVLVWMRVSGEDNFATSPLSVLGLAAAAVIISILSSRAHRSHDSRFGRWLAASSASLTAYLVLAAASAWAVRMDSTVAGVLVALWGAAWIPPLLLAQLAALAAVQRSRSAVSAAVVAGTAILTLGYAIVQRPQEPFEGVATAADDAWVSSNPVIDTALSALGAALLLAIPFVLVRAAARSQAPARTRLGIAALAATLPVLVVIVCLLLAVARNPGQVDPSVGSVAFILVLSGGLTLSVASAALAHRGEARARTVLGVIRSVVGGFAGVLAIGASIVAADALRNSGLAVIVIACCGIAAAAVVATWAASSRVADYLADAEKAPTAASSGQQVPTDASASGTPAEPRIDALTARENDVLELLAEGASNAGIATELVISERTVDAHLRSIFTKLELDASAGSNRRVVAARLWHDAQRDHPAN